MNTSIAPFTSLKCAGFIYHEYHICSMVKMMICVSSSIDTIIISPSKFRSRPREIFSSDEIRPTSSNLDGQQTYSRTGIFLGISGERDWWGEGCGFHSKVGSNFSFSSKITESKIFLCIVFRVRCSHRKLNVSCSHIARLFTIDCLCSYSICIEYSDSAVLQMQFVCEYLRAEKNQHNDVSQQVSTTINVRKKIKKANKRKKKRKRQNNNNTTVCYNAGVFPRAIISETKRSNCRENIGKPFCRD